MHEEAQPRQIVAESPDPCSAARIILPQIPVLLWADFSGTRSLSLLGLLGGGRVDFAGKRSLSLLGLLGGLFREAFTESAGSAASGPFRVS